MAVSAFKTYIPGEVLTASDLNASLAQLHDNGEDLGWPATKAKDLDGQNLVLDADADTTIGAGTDDQVDLTVAGNLLARFTDGVLTLVSADAGAGEAPSLILDRNSASPAASDDIGDIKFRGRDSAGASIDYAQLLAEITDPTDASEDGQLRIRTRTAGTESDALVVAAGVFTGGATGGDQGADTVNASVYYIAGSAISASASELNENNRSQQAVSDFALALRSYLYTGSTVQSAFDIDTGGATESFGPTGSGADNIWPALDALPSDAKAIIVDIVDLGFVIDSTGLRRVAVYARPGNTTWAMNVAGTSIARLSVTGVGTEEYSLDVPSAIIPLDPADLTFDLAVVTSSGITSSTATAVLKGFLV